MIMSALRSYLASGLYPDYTCAEGPVDRNSPDGKTALDYLLLLWLTPICHMICLETNRYTLQHTRRLLIVVNCIVELRTCLGIVVLNGCPTINSYWSKSRFLGVRGPTCIWRTTNERADCSGTYKWILSKGGYPFRYPQQHVLPAVRTHQRRRYQWMKLW